MKILYFEDNADLGFFTKELLEMKGHTVTWLQSRSNLPQSLESFDFVLSDHDMPGAAFSVLQALCGRENKPLLLVSGDPSNEDAHQHFVPKPYLANDLLGKIETLRAG